jgi:GDP-L-fucose synthase
MNKDSRILVTGRDGLVGSAVIRELTRQGYTDVISVSRKYMYHNDIVHENGGFDLRYEENVIPIFKRYSPEYVINCAGKVGGINANNTKSAEFIRDNIMMQTSLINTSFVYGVRKFMFLGSSCIYPKVCPQPIKEEYLLTSELEESNIGYAIAKISGMVMCRMYNKQHGSNFISAMPTNLYGPNDNFHLTDSHVLPALIRKMHDAKINDDRSVEFWGSGTPRREFLYVDDLAEAIVFLMNNYEDNKQHINIGTGEDVSIRELVDMVREIVDYDGKIFWNASYPDGTMVKRLDVTKINELGWKAKTPLQDGLKMTYKWFVENYENIRK